jgi:hypothetical protein
MIVVDIISKIIYFAVHSCVDDSIYSYHGGIATVFADVLVVCCCTWQMHISSDESKADL